VIEHELADSRAAQRRLLDSIKLSHQSLDVFVQELQAEQTPDDFWARSPCEPRHAMSTRPLTTIAGVADHAAL